ncbi:hypothetical protein GCM10023160_19060 [Brachybacterium paraconglomeratum]
MLTSYEACSTHERHEPIPDPETALLPWAYTAPNAPKEGRAMIRTLVLWPGPTPMDSASACRDYSSRMIRHGIAWSREGTIPDQDPAVMTFCREAAPALHASSAGRVSPWKVPAEFGTLWGEVLTLELDGPQPAAVATLARLAQDHELVLFDLPAHRLLTTSDITTTFGEPMIPAAATRSFFDLVLQCGQRWECVEELRVIGSELVNCTQAVDPFWVTPIQEELEVFEQVLDLLGCYDLEDLRARLEELIHATADDDAWR